MKTIFFIVSATLSRIKTAENAQPVNLKFVLLYLFFVLVGYLSGGLLFAYFIPKKFKHVDITELSDDKNPGTYNAFKYGGFWCGIFALALDIFKGFTPVFVASKIFEPTSPLFIPILIAPVLGHAFSPFFGLRKGGKCIAVNFGVLLGSPAHVLCAVILAGFLIFFSVIIIVNPNSLRTALAYLCCNVLLIFVTPPQIVIVFTTLTAIVLGKLLPELKAIFQKKADYDVSFTPFGAKKNK